MTSPISTPYDPDECLHRFGWIWPEDLAAWLLCYTTEDDHGDLMIGVYSMDIGYTDVHDCWAAEKFRGCPYIDLSSPACGPKAGFLVTAHIPGGGTLSVSREDTSPQAEADWQRVRAAMIGGDE